MGLKSYPKIFFVLLFIGFTLVLGMGLSSSFLPLLAQELDPTGILAGFVVSAWFFSRIFIELPSGIISDRIGRSRLLILGLGLGACGALLCAISNSVYLLILGRSIWGLGTALYFMNNTAIILDLFDPSMRGRALGTFQGIEFIGSFIGAPIGAVIAERMGESTLAGYYFVFYISAGLIICAFFLAFFSKGVRQVGLSKGSGSRVSLKEVLSAFRNWGVIVVCINTLSRMLMMSGINNTIFPLYLTQDVMLSLELVGVVIGARIAGHIIATVSAGYLSDKIGRKPILITGMLIEAVSMYLYTIVSKFEFLLLTGFLAGIGEGMVFVCLIVFLSDIVSSRLRGVSIGLYRTFMDIGGTAGPILFLAAFDSFGSVSTFYLAVVLLVVNALLVATVKTKTPQEIEQQG